MALPTVALIEAAITDIFDALKDAKGSEPSVVHALRTLWEVIPVIRRIYANKVLDVAIVDSTDAGVSEAIAVTGQLGLAFAAAHPKSLTFPVGGIFKTTLITADLTDNALATAKGGAVAVGDIYQVTGADAVKFLGLLQPDFTDDEVADL